MIVAGVDEAGRGSWAGPVVSAAVILKKSIDGLKDSKILTPKRRQILAKQIKLHSVWSVGVVDSKKIDEINILQATMLSMKKAISGLDLKPDFIRVDGNRVPDWKYNSECIIKGDTKILEISAASILAKTIRDEMMVVMSVKYPEYFFDKHKGYGTALHALMLANYGVCEEHRKSYKPCKKYL
jgi:ribonuclease HII